MIIFDIFKYSERCLYNLCTIAEFLTIYEKINILCRFFFFFYLRFIIFY